MASKDKPANKKKADYSSYRTYVYKVMKQVHPDTGMGSSALNNLDSIAHFVIKKVMRPVNIITRREKVMTITSRHVQTGVRLAFPGELAKHAVSEGTKAVSKYVNSKTGEKKGGKKHPITAANRAGIQFPPARIAKDMKKNAAGCKCRLSASSSVYLAAVVEYIIAEVCELAGNSSRDHKRVRIITRDIQLAIQNDEECNKFFQGFVYTSGVMPAIHSSLLPAKTASGKTKKAPKKKAKKAPVKKASAKKPAKKRAPKAK